MNLLWISAQNLRAKPLQTFLSVLLFALGVSVISTLLLASKQIVEKLEANGRGIQLVVGAKGSPLQLVLCSVFQIDNPTGNISVKDARFVYRHPLTANAIPLAMGDSYARYRIVGTNYDYVKHFEPPLAEGRLWKAPLEATIGSKVAEATGLKIGDAFASLHGIGATSHAHDGQPYTVVGIFGRSNSVVDQLILTGVESVWKVHEGEAKPEGNDMFGMGGAPPAKAAAPADTLAQDTTAPRPSKPMKPYAPETVEAGSVDYQALETVRGRDFLAHEDEEITSLLVTFRNPLGALTMPRLINENTNMQAASPAFQVQRIVKLLGVGEQAVRGLVLAIIVVSGLSVFISLYNSLKDRRYELALMRVMGASRGGLFLLILLEGLFISFTGCAAGLLLGHAGMEALGRSLESAYSYSFTGLTFLPFEEGVLFAGSMGVGLLASLVPAWEAFRTDIARTLSAD